MDCVLLKWGRGVHSNWRDGWWDERGVVWVVFMPVVGVVWIVWGVGKGVVRVVRRAVVVLGGIRNSRLLRWRRDGRKGESKREVILGEEEDVGLLGSRSRGSVSSNEIEIESSGTEK